MVTCDDEGATSVGAAGWGTEPPPPPPLLPSSSALSSVQGTISGAADARAACCAASAFAVTRRRHVCLCDFQSFLWQSLSQYAAERQSRTSSCGPADGAAPPPAVRAAQVRLHLWQQLARMLIVLLVTEPEPMDRCDEVPR